MAINKQSDENLLLILTSFYFFAKYWFDFCLVAPLISKILLFCIKWWKSFHVRGEISIVWPYGVANRMCPQICPIIAPRWPTTLILWHHAPLMARRQYRWRCPPANHIRSGVSENRLFILRWLIASRAGECLITFVPPTKPPPSYHLLLILGRAWTFWHLGTDGPIKTDEFSEKFQTAFVPPPRLIFGKSYCGFFQEYMTEELFIMAKICNINFWIGNDPPPFWNFSEKTSVLVGPSVPKEGWCQ